MFLFDGGILDPATTDRFVLPEAELSEWALVKPDEVDALLTPSLGARLHTAFDCLETDGTAYLEDGVPLTSDR